MAKRAQRLLGIVASLSAGVTGYMLYWDKSKGEGGADTVLNNDPDKGAVSPSVDLGIPATSRDMDIDGTTKKVFVVDLATLPDLATLEGDYDFGSAAYDGVNESDITEAEDIAIDFTPPEAPGKVFILSTP